MALSDALIEATKARGPRCSMCVIAEGLTEADRASLDAALVDLSVTSAAITRALVSEGHKVSAESVRRHRSGECSTA